VYQTNNHFILQKMPRYYEGDIHGQFDFLQPFYCMEAYGAVCIGQRVMFNCGCYDDGAIGEKYYNDIRQIKGMYCIDCYETMEDAEMGVKEDDDKVADLDGLVNFIIAREAFSCFGMPFIAKHQSLFEKHVVKIEFSDEISVKGDVTYKDPFFYSSPTSSKEKKIVADLIMLKHIQHYFKMTGTHICSWTAEEE